MKQTFSFSHPFFSRERRCVFMANENESFKTEIVDAVKDKSKNSNESLIGKDELWKKPALQELRESGDWDTFRKGMEDALQVLKDDGNQDIKKIFGNMDFQQFVGYCNLSKTSALIQKKAYLKNEDNRKYTSDTTERQSSKNELMKKAVIDTLAERWVSFENTMKTEIGKNNNKDMGTMKGAVQEFTYQTIYINGKANNEASKLYRTEAVGRLQTWLNGQQNLSPTEKSKLLLSAMEALKSAGQTPDQALVQASNALANDDQKDIGRGIDAKNKTKRTEISNAMRSGKDVTVEKDGTIKIDGKEYTITQAEILTGAAMAKMDPSNLEGFMFKNFAQLSDDKYIGQMRNGCEGNLVVVKLKETPKATTDETNGDKMKEYLRKYNEISEGIKKWNFNGADNFIVAQYRDQIEEESRIQFLDLLSGAFQGHIDKFPNFDELERFMGEKTSGTNFLKKNTLWLSDKEHDIDYPPADKNDTRIEDAIKNWAKK